MPERDNNTPRLYGISPSNSNRQEGEVWGKNQFNSAFPTALACHMRDNLVRAIYVRVAPSGNDINIENAEIGFDEVFNSRVATGELFFSFETKFHPYLRYDHNGNELDSADLVIKSSHDGDFLRPLQIKLTVTPDDGTSTRDQEMWSPELVLRPSDTSLCALGMFDAVADSSEEIRDIFDRVCYSINWNSLPENEEKKRLIFEGVKSFIKRYSERQKPYLLHPIWMTEGKQPNLAANGALDIFVWSDHALIAACLHKAKSALGAKMNRGFRAIARFARTQHDLAIRGNTNLRRTYREMDFGRQTDKEVALSGRETREFLTSPHRCNPRLRADVLREIILNNGHRKLSPERRFDQTIYFTAKRIFGE